MRTLAWTLLLAVVCCASLGCPKAYEKRGPDGGGGARSGAPDTASAARYSTEGGTYSARLGDTAREAGTADAKGPVQGGGMGRGQQRGPGAGQLTAGSFDDSLDLQSFHSFVRKLGQSRTVLDLPARFQDRRVTILVRDSSGQPVDNARVVVRAGGASVQLLTRTDGRAVVVTPWDGLPNDMEWTVTVTPSTGGDAVTRPCTAETDRLEVVLPQAQAQPTRLLDLAIVLDTTGSMGDELEYLKSELKWIATTLSARFPQVKQRYALIVYRDEGDEYVTRTYPFTTDVDQLVTHLKAQRADGGGDYPEAVHKAMEEAAQLPWSSGRAARVLVHVADAPPHLQDFERSLKAVDRVRKAGVAFYPVACSGYDPACEFHMRTSALLTGGQFLFLTNDSGIGEAHAEPTITGYHVERLNQLLVRMIAGEIAGHRIEPQPGDILRSVGQPPRSGRQ